LLFISLNIKNANPAVVALTTLAHTTMMTVTARLIPKTKPAAINCLIYCFLPAIGSLAFYDIKDKMSKVTYYLKVKLKWRETLMKTKKFEKKLTINKKTIVDLVSPEMSMVQGGKTAPLTYTCGTTVCPSNPCC
jgi:hypothetical protein